MNRNLFRYGDYVNVEIHKCNIHRYGALFNPLETGYSFMILALISVPKNHSSWFSGNSEAFASELPENHEQLFPSLITQECVNHF